ncbi:MAG: hypothetical protein AAF598_00760 [Bacteroidota bacterium]
MAYKKDKIIDEWKERGHRRSTIRRRIKRAESYCRRNYRKRSRIRNSNERAKFKVHPYNRRYSRRELDKATKTMILGGARYGWKETKEYKFLNQYYTFNMRALGPYNVDRLLKPGGQRNDILVDNSDGMQVRLYVKKYFLFISGIKEGNQIIFPQIPSRFRVTVFATQKLENGQVKFGMVKCKGPDSPIQIENVEVMDMETFEQTVETMTKISG